MNNSNNWYEEMKVLVESNSRAIQAMTDDTTLKRLEALVESNSRSIQAMADDTAAKYERELEGREELRQAMLGIANLVSSLDEDRPTILRKLNSIENKVDRILEQGTED